MGSVDRHLNAARIHDEAAARYKRAARLWVERGDETMARLERRNSQIERDAALAERKRAELIRGWPASGTAWPRAVARLT